MYLCCLGRGFAEYFDFEVAERRVECDRLFGSRVGKLGGTEREKIHHWVSCVRSRWRWRQREAIDLSDQKHPNPYALTITYTRNPPFLSPIPSSALPIMLRANQRPPSILGDDPFSHALKPPAHEPDYEKHARLEREIEAKRISDRIDDEIRRDKERFKRSKQDVKVGVHLFIGNPLPDGSGAMAA